MICSEVGASVKGEKKKNTQNDWISRNWNETLTAEAAENNGRPSLSLLSDRLELFVHSLSLDFSVLCLQQWHSDTTLKAGIKLDNGVYLHQDVHLEGVSFFLLSFLTCCHYSTRYCLTSVVKHAAATHHLNPVHVLSSSSVRLQWTTLLWWFEKLPCASSYRCTAGMEPRSSLTSLPKTQQRGRPSSTKPSLTSLQR